LIGERISVVWAIRCPSARNLHLSTILCPCYQLVMSSVVNMSHIISTGVYFSMGPYTFWGITFRGVVIHPYL